jgi:hypothetical protein
MVDGEYCLLLPREAVERTGLHEGQQLKLRADPAGIEITPVRMAAEEDFDRQLAAARLAMRKYHVALNKLAQE